MRRQENFGFVLRADSDFRPARRRTSQYGRNIRPGGLCFSYDDVDDAVDIANSLPTAFQAAVYSRDIDQAMSLVHRLDASAVMINDHTAFRDDVMPFAGLRESGLGTGGIPYTLEDMQIDKMVVIKSST